MTLPPHAVEAQRLAEQLRGQGAMPEPLFEVGGSTCQCVEPDWSHDGISSDVRGRLCRSCRLREGRNRWHHAQRAMCAALGQRPWPPVEYDDPKLTP